MKLTRRSLFRALLAAPVLRALPAPTIADRAAGSFQFVDVSDVTRTAFRYADATAITARTFSAEEIARIFNVPPHLIQDLGRSTYSNFESDAEAAAGHILQFLEA